MKMFLLRNGPPTLLNVSNLTIDSMDWKIKSKATAGNLSRLTSRGTVWPNGCSESESKSGYFGGCTLPQGGPEATLSFDIMNEATSMPPSGPVVRVITGRGLAFLIEGAAVHTTCNKTPLSKLGVQFNHLHVDSNFGRGVAMIHRHKPRTASG